MQSKNGNKVDETDIPFIGEGLIWMLNSNANSIVKTSE